MNTRVLLMELSLVVVVGFGCSSSGSPTDPGGDGDPEGLIVSDVTVNENVGNAQITVLLSSPAASNVTFAFATSNGSATGANDFVAKDSTGTITAGATSVNLPITIVDDAAGEFTESFVVTLRNATGALLADSVASVTINFSDNGPTTTWTGNIQPLLADKCATPLCHGQAGNNTNGFVMGMPPDYNAVRNHSSGNGAAVNVATPGLSNLYRKTTTNPPFGDRMPKDGPYLSLQEQETILAWISQGALSN